MRSLVSLLVIGCIFYLKFYALPVEEEELSFQVPFLSNSFYGSTTTGYNFTANNLQASSPIFISKFNFGQDSIDINKDSTSHDIFYDGNEMIFGQSELEDADSLNSDGFECIIDYDQITLYNSPDYYEGPHYYIPVYLVNNSQSNKAFFGHDTWAYGIQEAQKDDGYWSPIERQSIGFCGNGEWRLIVRPKEFVLVLFPKYEGDYQTLIRARIKVGQNIYVTNSFLGCINKSQFSLNLADRYESVFKNTENYFRLNHVLYGASPAWHE